MTKGLDAQQQIFASNPDDRRAFEALEEHFFLEGDWSALARVYRSRIAAPAVANDPALKGPLLFRLGQILEERIVDLDAAADTYWTLARLDRQNRPALRQLRGIHERRGQWDMVLQLAELESATDMPPYERAQFEADLGRIWHRHLGDRSEAERAYQRALAIDAEYPGALEGLAELCLEAGRHEDAAHYLERLTARLRGPERAPFWLSLGRLQANVLGDRERARHCFAAAVEDDPMLTQAVEWSLLLATEQEDWEAVAELLEHRFDLASGARHRAAIAVEASQIHLHRRHSLPNARAWIERATELVEDDGAVLRARADLERMQGDDEALRFVLERLVKRAEPRVPRPLWLELAEIHARRGRPAEALEALGRAGAVDAGGDRSLLELRARCLRETGAKQALAEVLEMLVGLDAGEPVERRRARLIELAALCEDELDDAASAESHWRAAFALDPADPLALSALERLQRKREDHGALRETLGLAVQSAGEPALPALCTRLGTLLLEAFDDLEGARAQLDRALAIDPRHRPALAALHRLAERSHDPALQLDACAREAAVCEDGREFAALGQRAIAILMERGELETALDWATRVDERLPDARAVLERKAELEARLGRRDAELETLERLVPLLAGAERNLRLHRRAELRLERGDAREAARDLEAALESQPGRIETLQALVEAYTRLGRAAEQARVLRALADRLPLERRAEALVRLARLLEDPIGDLPAAIAVRWQILELPSPPDDAVAALTALLELAGRHTELVQLLERERQRHGDGSPEARRLDLERGRLLLDALGDCEAAAALFSALHERDPGDDGILELLERALRAGHDAAGLCALLARRAGWESTAIARAPLELERAQLLEEVLGQPHEACDVYEAIVQEVPESAAAVLARARLESLCESTGQWSRLKQLLVARVASLAPAEATPLRERIAEICRDQLQDPMSCANQLEAIAAVHPERVHVWQQLHDLYTRVLDRPEEWLRVAHAELSSVPTPRRELALRVAIGRLLLDDGRRPGAADALDAIGHYERAFQLDPSHAEAAEVLVRHFERSGQPHEVVRVLEAHLGCLDEVRAAERDGLRLRLARVVGRELGDDGRARRLLEAVREARGAVPEVAEPLAEILLRTGGTASDRALADLCRDTIAGLAGERERLPWRKRLAAVAERLDELDEAARCYRALLAETPGDVEAEDALARIYERTGEREPLIALLEQRLAFAATDDALALRLRVARLYEASPSEAPRALAHLEQILEQVPHHREALEQALALAPHVPDPERHRALLDLALALPQPAALRAERLERRSRFAGDDPASDERAIEDLRAALGLDPTRSEARRAMRERLFRLERWPAVLDGLSIEADCASGEARIALLEEGVELATAKLGPDAALPWLARLRALDEELACHTDPSAQIAVQLERARLLEVPLAAPGRAVLAYQAALAVALAPDRARILPELDRLLAALNRPLERAAILEQRVVPLLGRAGLELRRELAELYCIALAKPENALVHLRANVAATVDVPEEELHHLGLLAAALRASGREEEWAATAERELLLIEQRPELRDHTPLDYQRFLREEIARVLDAVLGDPESALLRIRELCDDERLASSGIPLRTQERLHDLLRRTGRSDELALRLAKFLGAGHGSARDWLELALLREEEQSDFAAAAVAYREAERDAELRLEAIRGRRRCAERLGDDAGLASALRDELAVDEPGPRRERGALARRLGALSWSRLQAADDACAAYRLALELEPRDREALVALIAVHEARGDRDAAIDLYRRELALLGEGDDERARRGAIQRRLAQLLTECFGAAPEAIASYRAADSIERLSPQDERALALLLERTGDASGFAETFGRWCDREGSGAQVEDHLRLATHLAQAGQRDDARQRAERAVALAPEHAGAWSQLGRLEHESGADERAIAAFERAAGHSLPIDAARHCLEAARIAEPLDLERAHGLLGRSVRADASRFAAQAMLTRVASRLGRHDEALRAAEAALELAIGRVEPREACLELALLGGRAATVLAQAGPRIRLFQAVLALEPDHVEALDGLADALFGVGDLAAAKTWLERRIALDAGGDERARQHWMLGSVLEAEGQLERAADEHRAALAKDPALDPAHESLVRLEERAAKPARALEALETWAQASREPALRARAWLRAAEHALAGGDPDRTRRQLERATEEDGELGEAWVLLCEVSAGRTGESELRRLCERALAAIAPGTHSARIALRLARLAEIQGDRDTAVARYGEAWRWDPRCGEAALCESRLARMAGDWLEADGILARFLEAHPDPTSTSLAQIQLERGRLLSGPLEAFDDAIHAYRRALELQPGLAVARSALAGLLLHAPDRWKEALALHREILTTAPTTAASLRAVATIAERRGQTDVVRAARAVLGALGLASPTEGDEVAGPFPIALNVGPPLASPQGERLRRLAHLLRAELAPLLEGEASVLAAEVPGADALPCAAILSVEEELTAKPLPRLEPERRRAIFLALAGLFLDPGGNGGDAQLRDPLDRALGLWTRRKVRRIVEETDLASLEAFDWVDWSHTLRTLAAAQVLDREHAALRPVLRALVSLEDRSGPTPDLDVAELGGVVASCEPARRLLVRIADLLCEKLERSR